MVISSRNPVPDPARVVTVEVPRELIELLDASASAAAAVQLTELAVLELFREGRLSTGRAARLLGLSIGDAIDLLGRRGIPYLDDDEEELRRQVAASSRHRRATPSPTADL